MEYYPVVLCETYEQIQQAFVIRRKVFVLEQQISEELERDEKDEEAQHFLAFADDRPVATARLIADRDTLWLGRMAVLEEYRRQGVGRALIKAILQHVRKSEANEIKLHSQASARLFYAAMGFVEEGAPYIEAGIVHITMRLDLRDR